MVYRTYDSPDFNMDFLSVTAIWSPRVLAPYKGSLWGDSIRIPITEKYCTMGTAAAKQNSAIEVKGSNPGVGKAISLRP